MADALVLGSFITWAPRDVIIWQVTDGTPKQLHSFSLPPASRIVTDDFQNTLKALLEKLKTISVSTAPPATELSLHYHANLCLRNLQELAPGLTVSARIAAGQTEADDWLESAPAEKAWMSLWRMLFLIGKRQLPPGLKPEKLEQVMRYALADHTSGTQALGCLDIRKDEPPLQDQEAVRLHHLASRLRQLGWPQSHQQATALVDLLLSEVSYRYGLVPPRLPWDTDDATHWVNCTPPRTSGDRTLIVPRPCHAGWAVRASLTESAQPYTFEEDLFSLAPANKPVSAVAVFKNTKLLQREQRESQLIRLRQAWPNRRFDLPRKTPAWLWQALFLSGQASDKLSLVLPQAWHKAAGVEIFWSLLREHYQLTDITECGSGRQALRLIRWDGNQVRITAHLAGTEFALPPAASDHKPGTLQIWLLAPNAIRALLHDREFAPAGSQWSDWTEPVKWGTYLFLRTRLGRYLWDLCSDGAELPDPGTAEGAAQQHGLLLPDERCLTGLGLSGSLLSGEEPEDTVLEREFASIFGAVPEVPQPLTDVTSTRPKARRSGKADLEQIIRAVFVDGVPLFPEHYLMNSYRPELLHYTLHGPLHVAEEFFDCISLSAPGTDRRLEISGRITAEALILVSHSGRTEVELPKDEQLLQSALERYRADLKRLWDNLVKECRRIEPHRQAAIRLAHRIWRQQGLPPAGV